MAGYSDGLSYMLALCDEADSICLVRECRELNWPNLQVGTSFGITLYIDLGWKTVSGLKLLCRTMSHHGRGEHPCQLCNATLLPENESIQDHILAKHNQYLDLGDSVMDSAELIDLLRNVHVEILSNLRAFFVFFDLCLYVCCAFFVQCVTDMFISFCYIVLTWAFRMKL